MSELPILDIQTDAGGVVLSWDGTAQLQSADTPSGPWTVYSVQPQPIPGSRRCRSDVLAVDDSVTVCSA